MPADDAGSVFRSPAHRYEVLLDVFEGVNRYIAHVGAMMENGAGVLKDPSRLGDPSDPAYGTIWASATDMNMLLKQWQICLNEAWTAWNQLPAGEQASVPRPSHALIAYQGQVFKEK